VQYQTIVVGKFESQNAVAVCSHKINAVTRECLYCAEVVDDCVSVVFIMLMQYHNLEWSFTHIDEPLENYISIQRE